MVHIDISVNLDSRMVSIFLSSDALADGVYMQESLSLQTAY